VFSERTWDWVQVLVVGTILAPGKQTVTSVLRVMSMSDESQFQRYHRVLNRAVWSSLLAHRLHPDQPLPVRSAAWYTKSEATFSDVITC